MKEIKRYKLLVTKEMSHRYEMYSVGNIVNNFVICMATDDNSTYHGAHFEMYRNIRSLCYLPGTNIVLQVSYTSKQTHKLIEKEARIVVTRGGAD